MTELTKKGVSDTPSRSYSSLHLHPIRIDRQDQALTIYADSRIIGVSANAGFAQVLVLTPGVTSVHEADRNTQHGIFLRRTLLSYPYMQLLPDPCRFLGSVQVGHDVFAIFTDQL